MMPEPSAAPFASILLPIIDRAETLEKAIPCALNQSRQDIELLIVGSGATAAVLDIANRFADTDARIRVLDLPPSPERTTTARATALGMVRSDRIFILQDDDVWLPTHVEVLGGLLDNADFASSATLAVTLSGALQCWPCAFNNASFRQMYQQGGPKLIYEAHYAFRRSAYERAQVQWENVRNKGCSRHLLDCFVNEGGRIRWAATAECTAISLNSPPRWLQDNAERADEMQTWLSRIDDGDRGRGFICNASYAPILLRVLRARPASTGKTLTEYLSGVGIALDGVSGDDELLAASVTDQQRLEMQTLFDLFSGRRPPMERLAELIPVLLQSCEGHEPMYSSATSMLRHWYSWPEVREMLELALRQDLGAAERAYVLTGRSLARLIEGDAKGAEDDLRNAEDLSKAVGMSAVTLRAKIALAQGRIADAVAAIEPYQSRGMTNIPIVNEVAAAEMGGPS